VAPRRTSRESQDGSQQGRPVGLQDSTTFERQGFQLAHALSKWARSDGVNRKLVSVTLYPPDGAKRSVWMVLGKGFIDGVPVVAFHRSPDPLTALLGFFQKAFAGSLTWKRDTYRKTEAEQLVAGLGLD